MINGDQMATATTSHPLNCRKENLLKPALTKTGKRMPGTKRLTKMTTAP